MLGIRRIVTMVTLINFSSVIPKLHVHKAYVKKNYIIIERNPFNSYARFLLFPLSHITLCTRLTYNRQTRCECPTSSHHHCGGANISSASKDVLNWSLSSTFIADHKPLTKLCVWCININPTRERHGCPFFVATKDSRQSRYPRMLQHVPCCFAAVRRSDVGWSWPPIQCRYYDGNVTQRVGEIKILRV